MDRVLPMACSISYSVFKQFSSFLEWAPKHRVRGTQVVHYLDDSLFCGFWGTSQCQVLTDAFQE